MTEGSTPKLPYRRELDKHAEFTKTQNVNAQVQLGTLRQTHLYSPFQSINILQKSSPKLTFILFSRTKYSKYFTSDTGYFLRHLMTSSGLKLFFSWSSTGLLVKMYTPT